MTEQSATAMLSPNPIHFRPPPLQPRVNHGVPKAKEILPFTVRLVRNQDDLRKAVQVRHAAYARHLPAFAETLREPEAADFEIGTVVLLAESKLDGSPMGTIRLQTNRFQPLCVERSVQLPARLQGRALAEATRLAVSRDGSYAISTILFKAFFMYCQRTDISSMVCTARSPVDRQYDRLLFKDVDPDMGYVPIRHVGNIPHRIMSLDVHRVEPLWEAAQHPLFEFFFKTKHPDIDIDTDETGMLKLCNGFDSECYKYAVM